MMLINVKQFIFGGEHFEMNAIDIQMAAHLDCVSLVHHKTQQIIYKFEKILLLKCSHEKNFNRIKMVILKIVKSLLATNCPKNRNKKRRNIFYSQFKFLI